MAHKHSVYDTDAHFKIDAVTRAIKNDSSGKTVLIQGDHCSERFTFEVPRMVDGHDLSLCNVAQIHYINIDSANKANTSTGVYEADDLQISPESDDVVILSWLISGNATKYAGLLNFLVKFKCIDDAGKVVYVWNTAIFTGISISSGINNGEAVVEEYADILEQWRQELVESGGVSDDRIEAAVEAYMAENPVEVPESSGGLDSTASALLITILRNGVFSSDQSANITALENALGSSGSGSGGETPDEPDDPEIVTYTITNNLTNVTSNNSKASVTENSAYTATLTAAEGYELDTVTVTMGGVDVTSTVYADGKITIAAVTGNVIITAAAVAESTNSGESVEMAASTLKADAINAFKMYTDGGATAFTGSMATRANVCFLSSANAFGVDTDVKITLTNAGQAYDYFCVASTDWDGVTKLGVKNEDDTAYIMANAYYTESAGESSWKNPFGTREISYTVKAGYRLLVASYVTDLIALAIDVRGVA